MYRFLTYLRTLANKFGAEKKEGKKKTIIDYTVDKALALISTMHSLDI